MKHSSSGETKQEAYEVLPIDFVFADTNLNYTFFSQSGGEGRQLSVFPPVNRNVTLFASTFRIIRIILDTLVCLLFFLSILPSFAFVFIQSCFIISTILHHSCNLFITLLLLYLSFNIADLPHKTWAKTVAPTISNTPATEALSKLACKMQLKIHQGDSCTGFSFCFSKKTSGLKFPC